MDPLGPLLGGNFSFTPNHFFPTDTDDNTTLRRKLSVCVWERESHSSSLLGLNSTTIFPNSHYEHIPWVDPGCKILFLQWNYYKNPKSGLWLEIQDLVLSCQDYLSHCCCNLHPHIHHVQNSSSKKSMQQNWLFSQEILVGV